MRHARNRLFHDTSSRRPPAGPRSDKNGAFERARSDFQIKMKLVISPASLKKSAEFRSILDIRADCELAAAVTDPLDGYASLVVLN